MKKCWVCKKFKNLEEFYKDSTTIDNLQKACKICQKERNKKYNQENKKYFEQKNKETYQKSNLNNPKYNHNRYVLYKNEYLKRQDFLLKSARGRLYSIFDAARTRSKKYKLEFIITLQDILDLYEIQNKKCLLTNIDFSLERKGRKNKNPFAPSIDRINSEKGYTKNNIRLVCVIVNLALNNFGDIIFDKMCKEYINNLNMKGG